MTVGRWSSLSPVRSAPQRAFLSAPTSVASARIERLACAEAQIEWVLTRKEPADKLSLEPASRERLSSQTQEELGPASYYVSFAGGGWRSKTWAILAVPPTTLTTVKHQCEASSNGWRMGERYGFVHNLQSVRPNSRVPGYSERPAPG